MVDNYDLKKVTSLENVPGTIKDGDGYIWDPTGLPDKDLDDSKVPLEYRRLAIWMRSKLFGKEVRETIARLAELSGLIDDRQKTVESFLVDFIQSATEAELNSGPEIVQARGGRPTLAQRLYDKLDKGSVSVNDIDKNLGKLDQTYMSDTFLQQMAGNAPINTVPADDSLTTEKYVDNSITVDKVEYIIEPTNFYEVEQYNVSFDLDTWAIIPNHEYSVSIPIYVTPGKEYLVHVAGAGRIVAYNKGDGAIEMTAISSSVEQVVYVPNSNTRYIRVQTKIENIDQTQVNKGSVLLPYSKYFVPKVDTSKVNVFGDYMANEGEEF